MAWVAWPLGGGALERTAEATSVVPSSCAAVVACTRTDERPPTPKLERALPERHAPGPDTAPGRWIATRHLAADGRVSAPLARWLLSHATSTAPA